MVDIFNLECLNHEHTQRIWKVLRTFRADFDIPMRSSEVSNPLLNEIYQTKIDDKTKLYEEEDPWWKDFDRKMVLNEQIQMEIEQKVIVKSIDKIEEIDEKLVRFFLSLFNRTMNSLLETTTRTIHE